MSSSTGRVVALQAEGAATAQSPGAGSRIQLAARGAQDVYLLGAFNPFTKAWKRHTPYTTKLVDARIEYTPGKRSVVDIPKSGDALSEVTLELVLAADPTAPPGARWVANVGHALLRRVRLLVGDAEVHNYERLWYDMYDKLYGRAAQDMAPPPASRLSMASRHVLYVPLRFLTSRKGSPRPSLPLYAMPRTRLCVDIEFETMGVLAPDHAAASPSLLELNVLCEIVDVDDDEKRRLLQPTMLAFESVLDSDALSYRLDSDGDVIDMETVTVDLTRVTKAVKALAWVAYDETASALFQYIPRPLKNAEIVFDGAAREREKLSGYYGLVQKYFYARRCDASETIGMYSFAMDAASRHATGAADFAALSRVLLRGTVSKLVPRFKLKVFSVYYNYLEVSQGSARLVFT